MRWLSMIVILSLPAAGFAQGKEPEPKGDGDKFFDFEGLVIDGELRKPGAFFASAREKVAFARLLRLRKSFIQQMLKSSQDPALKRR